MCGIAGFTAPSDTSESSAILRAMTDAVAHRGPDADGHHITRSAGGDAVALGHRRLAIIDLAAGQQPLHLEDAGCSMVYNGEVYNYIELREELEAAGCGFTTRSDTEVVLRAYTQWGEAAFARFRGMFALAIWDARQNRLVLARDPFGKKPLMVFEFGGGLVFGSELAALAAHPAFSARIDPSRLADYLIWKYVPGSGTLLRGVTEVPPGHYGIWEGGALRLTRYFSIPEQIPAHMAPPVDAGVVADFRAALEDAVRIRLRSDVPLGAFLSGGVDSSAIVALMAQMTDRAVMTFSVGFEDAGFSELWAARLVAERYKTDHHELVIRPGDFLDQLEVVTRARGAPLSEMSDMPLHALSHLAAQHVKAVLSGEGADELLGGYPKHRAEALLVSAQSMLPRAFDSLVGRLGGVLPYRFRRLSVLARAAQERDFVARQGAWFGLMGMTAAAKLAPGLFADYHPFAWAADPGPKTASLARALAFEKSVWLSGTLLERGDRMTMAASIEGRMPFMDKDLAAHVSGLGPRAFIDWGRGKAILRRAMSPDIPKEILDKPKAGFRVPVHLWLRGPMKDYAHDHLLGSNARLRDWLDRSAIQALWDDHQAQRINREKELWSLMTLEIFLRQVTELPALAMTSRATG